MAEDTVDWDAETYARVASPHLEWGRNVLERLGLEGEETVLDAGCGAGHVSKLVLNELPDGRLIGVDASPSMLEEARALFGEDERVALIRSDLTELELDEEVDAVFSNATFHWILDHERLFRRLHAALWPGGRLEAQCGGEGNVAEWKRAIEAAEGDERFSPYLRTMLPTYNNASVADTESRLERAGFEVERVWLEPWPVTPPEPREYVRSVGLAKHLDRLPENLRGQFVDTVLGSMTRPLVLQYVRLNISARKPA